MVLLLLPLLVLAPLASAHLYGKVIHLDDGDVKGYQAFNASPTNYTWHNWEDIAVFKGIPFAANTSAENRWRAPQPVEKWNGTYHAKDFGPVCPSATDGNNDYEINEGCLNLNIWTAAKSSSDKLPVVMWSYPALSTARDDLFNGGGMAHKEVVFVNYNYRTGVFGWLSTDELSEEFEKVTGSNSSGNWGILDQIQALKWIRKNIHHFGGDPDHITVMGQSFGSAATYHILNSPLTKGDIVGAIIESGVRDPHDPLCATLAESYVTLEANLEVGKEFLASVNVTTIAEARKLSVDELTASAASIGGAAKRRRSLDSLSVRSSNRPHQRSFALDDEEEDNEEPVARSLQRRQETFDWGVVLDHYVVPATYYETLKLGLANQVPVITGNTKDESGANFNISLSVAEYEADLKATYNGTWIKKFHKLYPATDNTTAAGAYNSQFSDRSKVGTYFWTQHWKSASSQPVWNYYWNHAPPGEDRGAYHESEINYVLNNLYDTDLPWEAEDYEIAKKMNDYWVNFIKTGNPNGHGLVHWPAATEKSDQQVQVLGDSFKQEPIADPAKVKLFAEWFSGLKKY